VLLSGALLHCILVHFWFALDNIDYECIDLEKEDIFILATDGVYEYINFEDINSLIKTNQENYNDLCKSLVEQAIKNGSKDNLTIQIIKIKNLPNKDIKDINKQLELKPLPHILEAREKFDGFTIIRTLSSSPRSHVYLAVDDTTKKEVVLKIPSTELKEDKAYLERFMLEDWIAKKINNAYVVKSYPQNRKQNYLYNVTEYIKGQTLAQWIVDNPKPKLQVVRDIIEQIAKGLYTFHRLEMIHQDLRPQNILIDETNSIKIIDFGSTKVEGIQDINTHLEQEELQGTALYSAPEYFWGGSGTNRSDIFSLAVITYQMISGKFPYDTKIARCQNKGEMKKLKYNPLYYDKDDCLVPLWVDEALKKACEIEPNNRYGELSEFIYDLFNPNKDFVKRNQPALIERNPMIFWQSLVLLEFAIILILMLN
jgi:protein phosphatase